MTKKKASQNGQAHSKPEAVRLLIDWHVPEGLTTTFANHSIIQRDGDEYFISFFELTPPLIIGTDEERRAALNELGSVRATCVSRIALSKDAFIAFTKAIEKNNAEATSKANGDTDAE